MLVTHDQEVASRADRKIVLKDGLVVEDSLPFQESIQAAILDQEKVDQEQNG